MNLLRAYAIYLTLISFNNVCAFNVLAIVTLPLKSHYMAFDRFFRELATRGHSVTVMNNYVEENPPANMTYVDLSRDRYPPIRMPAMSAYEGMNSFHMRLVNTYRHFLIGPQNTEQDCENLLINKDVASFLDKKQKFDVIFVEEFMSECGAAFAAALYDAPIIGITSHTLLPWAYSRLGIPFDFSSDAYYFSSGGRNPSLYHKIESYLTDIYMNYVLEPQIIQIINDVFKKHKPGIQVDVRKAVREQMKMMFVYQHFSVTGARLLPPQVIEIGGIHIKEGKKLPQDLDIFLSSATQGAIYVSFGSNLNASTMSATKIQEFASALSRIPQKVLWKIESPEIIKNENILMRPWFPQRDVLCHPKVLAFVSHGGMLSLSEAAHCGKPLLAIPFFGDQYSNAAVVEQSGLGTTLFFNEITSDRLLEAINYLTSPKLQKSARNIQDLWNDRPMNVLDSAIYWTEYVARHRSAPPSLPSKRTAWFQSGLTDVYITLGTILFLLIFMLIYLCKVVKGCIMYCFSPAFKKKND
ncbi:unnamed protein product [Leptosia nina]|uniref:UDP-glucuronosyltransferase n=1 Tax=Leptosia nina TaxID=320188 RepID=A0AAV1JSZ4_9NEOP